MKLLECLLTANDCYKTGAKIKPQGVMVHSTGADNPHLRRYVQPLNGSPDRPYLIKQLGQNLNGNHWNRTGTNACVHAFIGKLADGSVAAVQTLPWNHRGWHAGTGTSGKSANNTHISFEICEDSLADPVYFQQAYQAAVELTAMLCKEYGLNPLANGVVICHQDGYKQGIASNHGDVYNWFPKFGKTMDDFRADVVSKLSSKPQSKPESNKEEKSMPIYARLPNIPASYRPTIQKVMERGGLGGYSNPDPNSLEDNLLNIDETYCRVMTTLDRMGILDL